MAIIKDQQQLRDTGVSSGGNPLRELRRLGQSFWLDNISRQLIASGELKRLIADDQLSGITSNPSIFEKAISAGADYDEFLARAAKCKEHDAMSLYEGLAIRDIQDAADALRPTYEQTQRVDGYVSLEVSPYLARDTNGTVGEAHRLWDKVCRDNLLIKVPATPEGLPAIRKLIAEGINVNITLMFSQHVYEQVAGIYIDALEEFAANQGDVSRMASVASFFVSRIDTAVDALVDSKFKAAAGEEEKELLQSIVGRTAVANAKLAYQKFKEIFGGPRWQSLAAKGAHVQRLLWASTSTKNPKYRDVIYVEELIGRDTVNTMPPATVDAFRQHGRLRASLEEDVDGARSVMHNLAQAGISLDEVTTKLTDDGVRLFADAFDRLLEAVEKKRSKI
jgi:transaldolase / glucose-6-phosphate isomerase